MRLAVLLLVAALVLAACGETVENDATSTTAAIEQGSTAETETTTTPALTIPPGPTTTSTAAGRTQTTVADEVAPETEGSVMTGKVPDDLVANILADAGDRTGAAESDFTVIRAEPALWNDGSLGCPVPGQSYTQALINGYWVVLENGGIQYDYRVSSSGYFRLCEGGGSPPSNSTS
jgi:hypothetical protein